MSLNFVIAGASAVVVLGLAVIGVLASVRPPKTNDTSQIYVVISVLLAFAGVLLIAWQAHRSDQAQNDLTSKVDRLLGFVTPVATPPEKQKENLAELTKRVEQLERRKGDDLKTRAALLSAQILRFIADRERESPSLPRRETWSRDVDVMIRYSQETLALYSQRFGARVIALRNELAERGFADQQLDRFYEHPTNPIGMRIVGDRIGALAETLPP